MNYQPFFYPVYTSGSEGPPSKEELTYILCFLMALNVFGVISYIIESIRQKSLKICIGDTWMLTACMFMLCAGFDITSILCGIGYYFYTLIQ